MRRTVAAAVVLGSALSWAISSSPGSSAADDQTNPGSSTGQPTRAQAQRALRSATEVLAGRAPRTDASMALLRLRLTMAALPPADRRQAAMVLARPTDDPDFYGESYSVPAKRTCAGHICIHWVPTTRDAPPGARWVNKQLHLLNNVWVAEVKKLGYRRPISDGTRGGGGSGRFDVYLKELYHQGLYGLTVAEHRTSYNKDLYSSYLVIDNDFKRSQYQGDPMQVARVTAAHEFFHAIQYGYDASEDAWMLESTATWMEDQFDDSSNDNRQYLPWSQLRRPGTPLDTFDSTSFEQYGNWVFFEYLSERFGRRIVKSIWRHAAAFHGGGQEYSAAAIRSALSRHGGMTKVFGAYASGNTVPGRTYSEGRHYPAAPASSRVTLTRTSPSTAWRSYAVKHLAAVDLTARPGTDLVNRKWRLRVRIDGPAHSTMPAVVVLVDRRNHPMTSLPVHLSRTGRGSIEVPFSRATVQRVTVTLANTSTRFRCRTGGGFSCDGTSRAPHPTFRVRLVAAVR
jgi:hypothetical protein